MQSPTQDSAPLDLDAYLARIGYRGALAATREVLDALHAAHVYSIPFENLDVVLGRPIRVDLASVQAKLVGARRGGYCFEHNTLFVAALRRLGFKLTTLIARVRYQRSETGARTHMLALIELPEGPFIADVGFGGPGLTQPLRLVEGDGHARALDVVGLRREGSSWVLASLASRAGEASQDVYAFTLEEHLPIDYEMANHYTSTHPSSLFVNNLIAALPSPEGRVTLRNRELSIVRRDGVERVSVRDDALLDVLRERFGLELPAGTRFSCAGLDR